MIAHCFTTFVILQYNCINKRLQSAIILARQWQSAIRCPHDVLQSYGALGVEFSNSDLKPTRGGFEPREIPANGELQ
jgi:hypothetical protein